MHNTTSTPTRASAPTYVVEEWIEAKQSTTCSGPLFEKETSKFYGQYAAIGSLG